MTFATRQRRGHVLLEVLLSGTVLLMVSAGIVAGLVAASQSASTASHDAMAMQLAQEQLELILQQPTPQWEAAAGTTVGPTPCSPPGLTSWTRTVTYGPLTAETYDATAPAGLAAPSYVPVQVAITYCVAAPCASHSRTVTLSALRWKDD